MKAAWYDRQGPARDVLVVGNLPNPVPGEGDVRIRIAASGINPGDVKKRQDAFGYGMPFPRIIPHSDGAGVIDMAGTGVPIERLGERVWCHGAQSYRAFGTAAEYVVVPSHLAIPLPDDVSFVQGACLGIPGITAHRAVHIAGPVEAKTLLVQGGGGAVSDCAIALARSAGARVVATARSEAGALSALRAGAHRVVRTDEDSSTEVAEQLRNEQAQHIVEVDLAGNIALDEQVLQLNGSIATYASSTPTTSIPFWLLVFKNITLHFLGSDDFPGELKAAAARAINAALAGGWQGFHVAHRLPLDAIGEAHELVEHGGLTGRVVIELDQG